MCITAGFQKASFSMILLCLLPNSIEGIRMGRLYPLHEVVLDICSVLFFTMISILMNNCISFE